ncbi:uncharacterized protein LOC135459485 isoform X2 [Zonotrichia leucophrys gambelii]|uniref:uncharacterized protein LOC135459485 isoform X2 n=1 Tax=Zonotrichia leucophrys gambelii TaxID=257770 RepID=UPI0031401493
MASRSRPNEELWRELCRRLAAAGYERTVAQCRSKWKALKQAFHSERERRRRAELRSALLPPHFRAMRSIWKAAGQPVSGKRRMPVVRRLSSRRRRSAPAPRPPSSPEPPEHDVGSDTPSMLPSPMLQHANDEPESSGGKHVAGAPPTARAMPHTCCCVSSLSLLGEYHAPATMLVCPGARGGCSSQAGSALLPSCHTDLMQKGAKGKASFPGETSLGMGRGNQVLPLAAAATGSHETAATSEQPAAGEDASDTSLHDPRVKGLVLCLQRQVVHVLYTFCQQQKAFLENVFHNLGQGESGVPCCPGALQTSSDPKENPQLSSDGRCAPA